MNPVSSALAHTWVIHDTFWSLEIKNGGVVIGHYDVLAPLDKVLKRPFLG